MEKITQLTKNTKRLHEIVSILAKYRLAGWLKESTPEFIRKLIKTPGGQVAADMSEEERIRLAITELGTTFIKLGQILSSRADLVSPELIAELSKLQQDTPADPPEHVRETVEKELGRPLEELFSEFDLEAMASASIGQVHAARLPNGDPVVVKVQHPGIEEKITGDLEILMGLAQIAEKTNPVARQYQPCVMVNEFRRSLLAETDYKREENNLLRFNINFSDDEFIHIPTPYPELSTHRVLTMERLTGFSIADTEKLENSGIDKKEFVNRAANLYLDMIFRDGFFHADPHPGNIFVLSDGTLGLLDCGMVGRLSQRLRDEIEAIMLGAADKDAAKITDALMQIGILPPEFDRSALEDDIELFLQENIDKSLKEADVKAATQGIMDIIRNHHIVIPAGVSLLLKVIAQLDGSSQLVYRDFNLVELLKPYHIKAEMRKYSPKRIFKQLQQSIREWERLLKILPGDLTDILSRIRAGKFHANLMHRGLDAVVNRLVYGIVVAALFLGSCMLISSEIPPLVYGISALGAGGVILAFVLGIPLIRAIRRSGMLEKKD